MYKKCTKKCNNKCSKHVVAAVIAVISVLTGRAGELESWKTWNSWSVCDDWSIWRPNPQFADALGVMISYLNGCTFLICVLHCMFFPLGLASYTEDQYIFTLDPHSFSLAPVPEGEPTPVPLLLFAS